MNKSKKTQKGLIDKISFKTLIPLTLISFSVSIVGKIFFISDNSNKNDVSIGQTGNGSNLDISQNNIQNTPNAYGQIIFISFLILTVLGILFTAYKIYKTKDDK
jgi:hypothetical protein